MKLAELIVPGAVCQNLSAVDKQCALIELVKALFAQNALSSERAIDDLLRREKMGSSLLLGGAGVAVPHATTTECQKLCIAFGFSKEGIVWDETTGQRAHLIWLVIAPDRRQAAYLRVLSRIARICDPAAFVNALRAAGSVGEVQDQIKSAEKPLGELPVGNGLPTFCVLGAGHGGMAMAGHLALLGCRVKLYNRSSGRIEPVRDRGGIDVTGEVEGFAELNLVTTNAADAMRDADFLMVVVPAMAHRFIAETIAPHLQDGQTVVLNPGRTGGALEVSRIIRERNPGVRPYIAEAQTLLYAARVTNPGQVHIHGIKNSVPLATLPSYQVTDVLPVLRKALPQFVPGDNVLKTSLDNIGAVFHPAITILNCGRIEDTHGDFQYYVQGVTPAVAAVLEAIDRERVAVACALGIRAHTAREWLYLAYDAAGKTLLDAMRANTGYAGIGAPGTVQHRYISEDVPASLVPIASIGEMMNVPCPNIKAIIQLASMIHGVDYWAEGRTVERLGIAGMSVKQLRFFVVGADHTLLAPAQSTLSATSASL